jgi:hypothetical protein
MREQFNAQSGAIMQKKIFTPEAIASIREMKLAGKKSVEIASAIGTTSGSLRARCCQLGLKFKRAKRADIAA